MNNTNSTGVFTKTNSIIRQAFLRTYNDLPNSASQVLKSAASLTILSVKCGDMLRSKAKALNATKITVTTTNAVAFVDDSMKVLGHITAKQLVSDYFPVFKDDVTQIMKLGVHELRSLSATPVEIPELSLLGFAFYQIQPANELALTALSLGKAQSLRNTVQSINYEKTTYTNPSFGVRATSVTDDSGRITQRVFIDGEMVKHTIHLKSEDEVVLSATTDMPNLDDVSDQVGELMIKAYSNQPQTQKAQPKKSETSTPSTSVKATLSPSPSDPTFQDVALLDEVESVIP